MALRVTPQTYGFVTRLLHWTMAIAVFAMFALGWWMVELDYYSPYYQSAPDLHRSVGIVLVVLLIVRACWRIANPRPVAIGLGPGERLMSRVVHVGFYPLLFLLMVAGYFISTLDGRSIEVFGLFQIPSIYESKGLEKTAGFVHRILAYTTIAVALVHAAGALKHHVVDRSPTLLRMLTGATPGQDHSSNVK